MLFEDALKAMREGKKVQRSTWKRAHYHMKPCLFNENGTIREGYDLSTEDLLADDWAVIDDMPQQQDDGA